MPVPVTVVMNCAGVGRRLGVGTTKALISVLGRPLIAWHLDMVRDVEDVRVVVGYQANEVISAVMAVRRDVLFVFNRAFATTGTAQSLALGAAGSAADVVSLDGDLLVHPADWRAFLDLPAPVLGTVPASSDQPVFVQLERDDGGERVREFSRDAGDAEWSGLVKFPACVTAEALAQERVPYNVYELLQPLLPMRAFQIRAAEIDTPDDYERALDWMRRYRASFEQ